MYFSRIRYLWEKIFHMWQVQDDEDLDLCPGIVSRARYDRRIDFYLHCQSSLKRNNYSYYSKRGLRLSHPMWGFGGHHCVLLSLPYLIHSFLIIYYLYSHSVPHLFALIYSKTTEICVVELISYDVPYLNKGSKRALEVIRHDLQLPD